MAAKTKVPAVEGWFTTDPDRPALLGTRCTGCGATFFPREDAFCRNPACMSREFEEVELSRTGTIWSFTDNRYQPPAPYVSPDPFVPYAIAAVELVLGTLFEDDDHEYLVWRWRPTSTRTEEPAMEEANR